MIVPEPAAIVEEGPERTLVVADVHVGFEAAMAARGVRMDSGESADEMAGQIAALAASQRASGIVLLGDTKSGTSRIAGAEWEAVPRFLGRLAAAAPTVIVPGNHDGRIARLAPGGVSITSPSGIVLGDTLLTHGHVMPSENLASVSRILMGHAHPAIRDASSVLGGSRVWASMRVSKDSVFPSSRGRLELTVMPSYNRYVPAGTAKRARGRSPILDRARGAVISAKIVTLEGAIVGDESALGSVF